MTTATLFATPTPSAAAAPCPDAEIVFARGTFEPPGLGGIGQSFVDAVQKKAAGKSVSVYAVNYPASTDFPTAVQGIRDAANRIEATAASCPNTRIVLGGFSQGAAVALAGAPSAHADHVAYLVNVTVRPGYNFPNPTRPSPTATASATESGRRWVTPNSSTMCSATSAAPTTTRVPT